MKRMTDDQKKAIVELRKSGQGYKAIANRMQISRDTVRSFCKRNHITVGELHDQETESQTNDNSRMTKCGKTIFTITTAYSEHATETLEKKLERLILNAAEKMIGN